MFITRFFLQAAKVENLRCEYLSNPCGVDVSSPVLSWMIVSSMRGDLQKAYQVVVSSSRELLAKDEGDMWNTGKVESDRSVQVEYTGKPLLSGIHVFLEGKDMGCRGKSVCLE